jgi:glucose/arabinose dehydrogenase
VVAAARWWTNRGERASNKRTEETALLQHGLAAWGQRVRHVFDRGFAGTPWLSLLCDRRVRFIARWPARYKLCDLAGNEHKAWRLVRGKRAWGHRLLWDACHRCDRKTGILAVPVLYTGHSLVFGMIHVCFSPNRHLRAYTLRCMDRVIRAVAAASLVIAALVASPASTVAQTSLSLPRGFHAGIFASGLSYPTALAVGPDRRVYVAQQDGLILAVGSGGKATVASGFSTPLGLAWHGHTLYVSSTGQIWTLTPSRGYRSFRRRAIVSGLPTGRHQNDGIAFQSGWMYVGVGSTCDACVESDPRSATIMRFHLNGSHAEIYARGLRNPYGLAFRPTTGALYATDNGRDDHDDQVPDELNRIVRGGNYGFPDCWGRGGGTHCKGTIAPVALFEPHSSADGLVFYSRRTFPERYRGDAFVAEWGDSVNGLGTGRILKDVHFAGSRVTVSTFATGFTHPVAVAIAPDSSLLVADWGSGTIWRIQANGH